jgi:hypothetical protein
MKQDAARAVRRTVVEGAEITVLADDHVADVLLRQWIAAGVEDETEDPFERHALFEPLQSLMHAADRNPRV